MPTNNGLRTRHGNVTSLEDWTRRNELGQLDLGPLKRRKSDRQRDEFRAFRWALFGVAVVVGVLVAAFGETLSGVW